MYDEPNSLTSTHEIIPDGISTHMPLKLITQSIQQIPVTKNKMLLRFFYIQRLKPFGNIQKINNS